VKKLLRKIRGLLYRLIPVQWYSLHKYRVSGFSRKWSLETENLDQDQFSELFWEKILNKKMRGRILEAACGDGLIGSFGWWLEKNADWRAECQERRETPRALLVQFRVKAKVYPTLFMSGIGEKLGEQAFDVVTARAVPEILWILRSIRRAKLSACVVGIWNRTGCSHWSKRLNQMNYRLVLGKDRLEIYQKK